MERGSVVWSVVRTVVRRRSRRCGPRWLPHSISRPRETVRARAHMVEDLRRGHQRLLLWPRRIHLRVPSRLHFLSRIVRRGTGRHIELRVHVGHGHPAAAVLKGRLHLLIREEHGVLRRHRCPRALLQHCPAHVWLLLRGRWMRRVHLTGLMLVLEGHRVSKRAVLHRRLHRLLHGVRWL